MVVCESDSEQGDTDPNLDAPGSAALLQRVFAVQRFAVLATATNDQPDTFLMAFAASHNLRQLILVSRRGAHKVTHINANPRVALMVNTGSNEGLDTEQAIAITAIGYAFELEGKEREECLELFLARHPYLVDFASATDAAVLCIDVAHYRIVSRFEHSIEWHPKEPTSVDGSEPALPEGAIRVVRVGELEWEFQTPRLTDEAYDRLHAAIEHYWAGEDVTAEATYRALIRDYPEFIDAHHHLALLLSYTGRTDEAYDIWHAATQLGLQHLPEPVLKGEEEIPWVFIDNRPFLRAYHALGLEYRMREAHTLALKVWQRMLSMNSDDNQGIRALAMEAYLTLGKDRDALNLAANYPDDGMPEILYGRVLALLRLEQQREAEQALGHAIQVLPRVAQELAKKRHRKPRELREEVVSIGSPEQAYIYWQESGFLWKMTPGALEFIRAYLETHPRAIKR
jgi:tetratricopeptide (TPR) repeat protein